MKLHAARLALAVLPLAGTSSAAGEPGPLPIMRLEPTDQDVVDAIRVEQAGHRTPPGEVELICQTKIDGALERCRLEREAPEGAGLGELALRVAPLYRASAPGPLRVVIPFSEFIGPTWGRKPTGSVMIDAMRAAKIGDPNGRAILDCLANPDGSIKSCRVELSEPDERYGLAAMYVARSVRIKGATYGGRPVEGRVKLPISFKSG